MGERWKVGEEGVLPGDIFGEDCDGKEWDGWTFGIDLRTGPSMGGNLNEYSDVGLLAAMVFGEEAITWFAGNLGELGPSMGE